MIILKKRRLHKRENGAVAIIAVLGYMLVKNNKETKTASENTYNMAFYEVVDYVQNVETYLAKSLISST